MERTELNLENTLVIWWAFAWRAALAAGAVGAVLGLIGGFIVGLAGSPELGAAVGGVLGWVGSIPASIWALRSALSRRYGTFTIALVRAGPPVQHARFEPPLG